jgi:hypothetical protein
MTKSITKKSITKKSKTKKSKRITKKSITKSKSKSYCVLFTMYIGDTIERREIYENRIKRWLDETSGINFYIVDSSNNYLFFDKKTQTATSPYYFNPRLFQFAFKQKSGFKDGNPSVPERDSMLKALKHFWKDFKKYDIVFKITGKYFIPHFDKLVKFNKDSDIILQNRTDTNGQNTEVIGFKPDIFGKVIRKINDDTTFEEVVAEINAKKLYNTERLSKLKLDSFTKRSDGSTLRYLFTAF